MVNQVFQHRRPCSGLKKLILDKKIFASVVLTFRSEALLFRGYLFKYKTFVSNFISSGSVPGKASDRRKNINTHSGTALSVSRRIHSKPAQNSSTRISATTKSTLQPRMLWASATGQMMEKYSSEIMAGQ